MYIQKDYPPDAESKRLEALSNRNKNKRFQTVLKKGRLMNKETKDEFLIMVASPNNKEWSYEFVPIGIHAETIKKSRFGIDLYSHFKETFDNLQLQRNFLSDNGKNFMIL